MYAPLFKPAKFAASACKDLDDLRQDLRNEPGGEPLHDFRVGYKKLRAFYRMNDFVMKGRDISLPKGWKKIYQSGGPLRDAELLSLALRKINQQANEEAINPADLILILEEKIAQHQASFTKVFEKVNPRLDNCKDWKKVNASDYDSYFKNQIAEWLALYQPPLYDDVLHELRKILKDLMYNHTWLEKMEVPPSALISQVPVSDIDKAQKLLGDYQDAVVRQTVIRQLVVIPAIEMPYEPVNQPEEWIVAAFRVQKSQRLDVETALENLAKQLTSIGY